MPVLSALLASTIKDSKARTILQQNIQALFHQEVGIEDDQSEGEGQDIVAGANFEKVPDCFLDKTTFVSVCFYRGLPHPRLPAPGKQPLRCSRWPMHKGRQSSDDSSGRV